MVSWSSKLKQILSCHSRKLCHLCGQSMMEVRTRAGSRVRSLSWLQLKLVSGPGHVPSLCLSASISTVQGPGGLRGLHSCDMSVARDILLCGCDYFRRPFAKNEASVFTVVFKIREFLGKQSTVVSLLWVM